MGLRKREGVGREKRGGGGKHDQIRLYENHKEFKKYVFSKMVMALRDDLVTRAMPSRVGPVPL